MTYSQELWEKTSLLNDSYYPINMFRTRITEAKRDQNILHLHWHEHLEFIIVMNGKAIFHIDNSPYEAVPGDILIVPPGGLHVGYSLWDGTVELAAIVFNAALFSDSAQDPVHAHAVAPFLDGRASYPVKLDVHFESNELFRSLLQQIITEIEEQKPAYKLVVKSRLHLLLTLLSRSFLPQNFKDVSLKPLISNLDRFKDLIRYVEDRYTDKLTINLAAKQVNMSPYHFCKTFKKLTGRTFIDYVNMHRMNEAERMLRECNLTVTEIADKVGCGNPNYLTKLYKRYKGTVPSQVRKQ